MARRKLNPVAAQLHAAANDAKWAFRQAWVIAFGEACAEFPFVSEHEFAEDRRWRFDFANLKSQVAVEVDGVGYRKSNVGRHQMGAGYEADCEKLNRAAGLGWVVLRFTPAMLARDPAGCVDLVRSLLQRRLGEDRHG